MSLFSERLRKLRTNKKLTQQQVADVLGVGRPTIAGYETKDKQPDYEKLQKLSSLFNVSIDYLLGNTDNPDPLVISEKMLPKELQGIGIEFLKLAKELENGEFTPEDIRMILKAVEVASKNKK